jgi:hypothetical protein
MTTKTPEFKIPFVSVEDYKNLIKAFSTEEARAFTVLLEASVYNVALQAVSSKQDDFARGKTAGMVEAMQFIRQQISSIGSKAKKIGAQEMGEMQAIQTEKVYTKKDIEEIFNKK